jgi:hypothetical protein
MVLHSIASFRIYGKTCVLKLLAYSLPSTLLTFTSLTLALFPKSLAEQARLSVAPQNYPDQMRCIDDKTQSEGSLYVTFNQSSR